MYARFASGWRWNALQLERETILSSPLGAGSLFRRGMHACWSTRWHNMAEFVRALIPFTQKQLKMSQGIRLAARGGASALRRGGIRVRAVDVEARWNRLHKHQHRF